MYIMMCYIPTLTTHRLTETPLMEDARIFFRTAIRLPEGRQFEVSLGSGVHEWRTQVWCAGVCVWCGWWRCLPCLVCHHTHNPPNPKEDEFFVGKNTISRREWRY